MAEQTTQYFSIKLVTTGNEPVPKWRIEDGIRYSVRGDLGPQVVDIEVHEEKGPPAKESSRERHGDYDG